MLGRWASQHPRNPLVRLLAARCRRILDRIENANDYRFATNGERRVLAVLARHPFTYILDVGANIGDWALMTHGFFPHASIHCFEIMPPTFEQLRERTRVAGIVANPFGLLDREGEVEVNYYPQVSAIATLTEYPHEFERVRARGRVMRGDEYVRSHRIERIDFLKLDVEGAEHEVLQGLGETLDAGRVDVVQFEYGQVSILTRFLLRDFYEFLTRRGYRVGKVYPDHVAFREYAFAHEDFRGSNFLAVRADRPELLAGL